MVVLLDTRISFRNMAMIPSFTPWFWGWQSPHGANYVAVTSYEHPKDQLFGRLGRFLRKNEPFDIWVLVSKNRGMFTPQNGWFKIVPNPVKMG